VKIKTNCSIDAGPGGSSAWYLTKAFQDLGHEIVTGDEADLVVNIDGWDHVDRLFGVPYFFWDTDSFIHEPTLETLAFDKLFIGGSPEDLEKYPEGTIFLPHAFDEEVHTEQDVEKKYDVCMIGRIDDTYVERNRVLRLIEDEFTLLYGQAEFGIPYSKAMSKSRVIFNQSLGKKNIPMRFFEGMAIGCLFENYNDNLDDLATPFIHYVPYTDDRDLMIKLYYYVNHPKEVDLIKKQAREHALQNHTYKHRAGKILQYV